MTERTRLIIHTSAASMLAVAVLAGRLTQGQADVILTSVTAILTLVSAVALAIAARNITEDSWSSIRQAIYGVMATVLAVLAVFGIVAPDLVATSLAITTEVLQAAGVILTGVAAAKVPARRAIEG